ncbi:MAG: type 1 glutamine amidotransferase domain-containing protein [Polyangiaceae bacterium]
MAKVAVVLASEFEDSELTHPAVALDEAGHEVVVIGTQEGAVLTGKQGEAKVTVRGTPKSHAAADFDALLIPGGYSPDHLRTEPEMVEFVKHFVEQQKLVAAICHGPQLLIEADVVRGKRLTSWPSVRQDLENAGASWEDREVVEDGNLITSRNPDDLPAFSEALVARLDFEEAPTLVM